ncbi:MAG: YIP1 family protein [Terriglobia bacterium]
MASLTDRMIRAAQLDVSLYEEVEADRDATAQAMSVVVLSSLALGVGSYSEIGMRGLIGGTFAALVGWFVWAFVTYWIGTRLLPEPQTQADLGQMLRTIGFSSSPGVLRVLGAIPGLWNLVVFGTSLWMLAAMVIAVRQSLDYKGTLRALGVCILGWLIQVILIAFLYRLSGSV